MTNDQQNRIEAIKTKWRHASDGPLKSDIDFLLSLVKSQEADGEVLTDLHDPDCLFVTHSGKCDCPYGPVIKSATTLMRDKCVEKVKARRDQRRKDLHALTNSDGHEAEANYERAVLFVLDNVIYDLESVTLDQVKPGEM